MRKKLNGKNLKPRILCLILKGLSMVSRLLLLIYIAKRLLPNEVGMFSLIFAIVNFSIILLGWDLYKQSQKKLMAESEESWPEIINNHIQSITIVYIIFLPLHYLYFSNEVLQEKYIYVFFPILIAEHLSQEYIRFLVVVGEPVKASWVLFAKSTMWIISVISIAEFFKDHINNLLDIILFAWLIGQIISLLLAWHFYKVPIKLNTLIKIDIQNILVILKVSSIFLISSLSIRGLLTFDKYTVKYLTDLSYLGIYGFYTSIALSVTGLIESSVTNFSYPKILRTFQQGKIDECKRITKETYVLTIIVGIILSYTVIVATPHLLNWMDKSEYSKNINLLWILIPSALLFSLSVIPSIRLYAAGKIKSIAVANFLSIPVFFGTVYVFSEHYALIASALGVLFGFIWLFLSKEYLARAL